ncbi:MULTISPECIES: ABC transporter permease [Actinomadura]|uniref:Transport permease protein n=1 Tax=Actinomadura livida TaxID=79909 RepID=A0A7W7ICI2_9ACTN|nr:MULTISPECIES: ABC transporter permease [Actinomadura]MBB4774495.1 ABC transporter DrrB family efflux protein [Actinomadura catellatispora]TDB87293.1 ABC transporter permease [Actinomadura sp. 7K534]GGT82147.1 transport permease protein [Actinomadura livida]
MSVQTLRWAVADGRTLTGRALAHWARRPGEVAVALLFPVMVVLMMGYLFGGQMDVPGGGSYREFIVPGMFALTMAFGVETTFAAVAGDAAKGVTDRFRAMPMAPSAVVVGRAAADMLHSVAALAVMAVCGVLIGWRVHDGIAGALAGFGLLLLLRFSLVWMGIYLGLMAKGPESVAAVQILVWPIGFLSSALIAPSTMPGWLGAIAEWNPMSATVTACRELFGDPGQAGTSWAAQHSVLMAVVWPLVIAAVFIPLSVRRYRAMGR